MSDKIPISVRLSKTDVELLDSLFGSRRRSEIIRGLVEAFCRSKRKELSRAAREIDIE